MTTPDSTRPRRRLPRIPPLAVMYWGLLVAAGWAQAATAVLSYPANGAVNIDTRLPFRWNAVSGAQAYRLQIGSQAPDPGTGSLNPDLYDSGSIGTTSVSVPALPPNQTLYARLWTQQSTNSLWSFSDTTFQAVARPATFLYPLDGFAYFDVRQPFRWNSVAGAQNYILRLGTTPGGTDLFNTNTLSAQTTAYTTYRTLPSGVTLYARLSTKLNDKWWSTDITFQALPRAAVFTYPPNGSPHVDTRQPFTWDPTAGAQAFSLKIGTTVGASDLVDSGELAATASAYSVPALPTGRTLYARLSTKGNNAWLLDTDISFQAVARPATFVYPTNGSTTVDTVTPFSWTPVAGAEAYFLKIGTSPGAQDIVSASSLPATTTSYRVTQPLPPQQTLYARISTRLGGTWWYNDISFRIYWKAASLIYPQEAQQVDLSVPCSWSPATSCLAYAVTIGTAQGGNDLVSSGEMTGTRYRLPTLPTGRTLWARLGTKALTGQWFYQDASFTVQARPITFLSPFNGATSVPLDTMVAWTAAPTINGVAPLYTVTIGTTPGASDLLNTALRETSLTLPAPLPAGRTLYAHIAMTADLALLYADSVFTTAGSSEPQLTLEYPAESDLQAATANGAICAIDAGRPFAWSPVEVASLYQLQIYAGTGGVNPDGQPSTDGLVLTRDSGSLHIPRVFFYDLPLGTYTGRLGCRIAGNWKWRTFVFQVADNGADATQQVQTALWSVNFVRGMADANNTPFTWTPLYTTLAGRKSACSDYTTALLNILKEIKLTSQFSVDKMPHRINVAFSCYNTHTLAEMYNGGDGRWLLLDATFDLLATRTADGSYATKEEVQQATLLQQWSDITYTPLGALGDGSARGYYLDYPLLFLNLGVPASGSGNSVLPYMQTVTLPLRKSGSPGIYNVQATVSPGAVTVDGQLRNYPCLAADATSQLFLANSISLPAGSTVQQALKPLRYVFPAPRWQ